MYMYMVFSRGEKGEVASKKDFIQTARLIAKESEEVVKMARKIADACTDKRMKRVRKIAIERRKIDVLTHTCTCIKMTKREQTNKLLNEGER